MDCLYIQTFLKRRDHWTEPGLGFRYHIHPVVAWEHLSRGDLDLYSRKCIGWELSRNIDGQLAMNALDKAIENRWSESTHELVHHSDQGVQYASHDYVDCLKEHNILISMSRKGNPYDNAFAESFMKTLKVEEVYLNEYGTFEDAYRNIWRFIETVYNKKRLHSALGYRSPEQFEVEFALNTVA